MTAIRVPVSFSLAGLVTITLFWFLGVLIGDVPPTRPVTAIPGIEFTPKIIEIEEPTPPRVPPPIPKPVQPPDYSPFKNFEPVVGPGEDESVVVPPGFFDGAGGGLGPKTGGEAPFHGGSDRGALPQVRIEPDYPQIAKARGIEGWITFRFTVTREGRVTDVEIVDADPPHVWDQATLRAVSSWRYQPKLEDGVPVEQQGVTATYRFKLDR